MGKKADKQVKPKSAGAAAAVKPSTKAKDATKKTLSTKKQEVKVKKSKKAPTPSSSSSESESDSSESESDSDSSEAPAAKPTKAANGVSKAADKVKAAVESSSEDSSDDSSSEEEKPKAAAVKASATKEESSSDSSDSDSSEEEEEKKPAAKAAAPVKAAKASKKAESTESESESDSDSSDSSEEEAATAAKESDDSSDSDDSDDSDDSSEDVEMEEPASKKRKVEAEEAPAQKKAKVSQEVAAPAEGQSATCFVGGLSWNVDDAWLKSEFEAIGTVVSARVITDKATGKSKGFGYVDFEDVATAQKAVDEMNNKEVDGRSVRVDLQTGQRKERPAREPRVFNDQLSEPSTTLFIGNLPWSATEDGVWELFSDYGGVSSVRLPTDQETGKLKGFGYLEFSDIEAAKKAVEAGTSSGIELDGRALRLDFSQPRSNNGGGGRGGPRGGRGGGRGAPRGGRGAPRGGRGAPRGGRGGGRSVDGGWAARAANNGSVVPAQGKKITF